MSRSVAPDDLDDVVDLGGTRLRVSFRRDGYLEIERSDDQRVYSYVSGSDEPRVERAARTIVQTLGLASDDPDEPGRPTR